MRNAWERLLKRDGMLVAVAGLSLVNGLPASPLFDPVAYLLYLFTRGSALLSQDALFYGTSLFISVMTLVVAGVPAALYERVRGLQHSTPLSLGIWFAATLLLALPGLRAAASLE
jgi:hypothetical protein